MSLQAGSLAARDAAAILHPMVNPAVIEERGALMMARGDLFFTFVRRHYAVRD